ncbi:MAG: tandem-95 repeat protein [Gammaproteobacteria bacterium]|nr:tandem-95 repeat protein [Gammaproteobacteria bacterium]
MKPMLFKKKAIAHAVMLMACPLFACSAFGADVYLRADTTTVTMPDGSVITMWGFAPADSTGAATGPVTVPGPALNVPAGDPVLNVNVFNALSEPVSVIIPGQITAMTPSKFTDATGRQRVRSFTQETAPGASGVYSWGNLQPGTYLYQSGTHPAVQVQMGLYGSVVHDAAIGSAYAGIAYDTAVTLLYSEIDPALHAAVAGGTYGTVAYPSTINYAPKYFLINGKPFAAGDVPFASGATGQTTLLRFLNAGLKTHAPSLLGLDMHLVAEDGKPYANRRHQYSVLLAAGKTTDALITPATAGVYTLQDRRVNSNTVSPNGGMLAQLQVVAGTVVTPVAVNDSGFTVDEDTTLNVAAPGVLGNDTGTGITAALVTGALHGTATLNADGSFAYTPALNYNGTDSFTYQATAGTLNSAPATVSISVNAVNDAPLAANDAYKTTQGNVLTVAANGVLTNDTDVDNNPLTAGIVSGPVAGSGTVALNPDGSFTYTPPSATFTGQATFTYQANDGVAGSNTATATITVAANLAPVAVGDTVSMKRNTLAAPTSLVINVLANDTDADGTLNPATVVITTALNKGGSATINATGTITYVPKLNFTGTESFAYQVRDNLGKLSNKATVRVNVTR